MLKFLRPQNPTAPRWAAFEAALLYETREVQGSAAAKYPALPSRAERVARLHEQKPPLALPVRFGNFVLSRDPLALNDLEGRSIALQRQPLICLDLLVRNSHRAVSRAEIRDAIWDQSRFVDHDQGINFIIYRIRTALNDKASNPQYIETLPQVGYRLVVPIEARLPEPRRRTWMQHLSKRWLRWLRF